jgi:putative aldouronate transport system permease protein
MLHRFIREMRINRVFYLMALPGITFILLFSYVPMPGLILAFKNYNFRDGIFGSPWAGWYNFSFFFGTDKAWTITFNTLYLNLLFIVFGLIFQIGSAILINEVGNRHFKRLVQSIQFLPFFFSWVVVSGLLYSIFSAELGSLNRLLVLFGLAPVSWYTRAEYWRSILVITNLWKFTGYGAVIYLSAIAGISQEYYEAAHIDGASKLRQIRHITLPLLVPTAIILTLLSIGRIFYGDFGMMYSIIKDNGMLLRTTEVIDTYVYRAMRSQGDMAFASAVGLYQSTAGFIVVYTTNYLAKRWQGTALF